MFIFITSLKHPKNCNSYERVGELLENTLQSVCHQTSNNFRVLVVCNKVPGISINQNVEFLEVDFPAPSNLTHPQTGMEAIRIDRGCKYMAALVYARRYKPSSVMFFDADDYISKKIVEHVNNQPVSCGWYVENGYQYQSGDTHLSSLSKFHKHCGTSLIYPYDMLDISDKLAGESSMSSIQSHTDEKYLTNIIGSHRAAVIYHQAKGFTFNAMPFSAAIWMLGNGENHSGKKGIPGDIPITDKIRDEFSFYPA